MLDTADVLDLTSDVNFFSKHPSVKCAGLTFFKTDTSRAEGRKIREALAESYLRSRLGVA